MNDAIPSVIPLPPGTERPLWSVMIPAYNCLPYLRQTLESVIRQDLGEQNMQIEVVDDCSTDGDVEQLVNEIGNGRIAYSRQAENVGSLQNFHDCLQKARGQIVHLLHGDDFVHPGFYTKLTELFTQYPEAGAACCRYQFVDEHSKVLNSEIVEQQQEGILKDWLLKLSRKQRTQYCAVAVRRSVYEELGSFYGVNYGEDWLMWVRIASKFPFAYTPQVLASYRRQTSSISGDAKRSGANVEKIRWVIEAIQEYLPQEKRAVAKQAAITWYSRYMMSSAFSIWAKSRDRDAALLQARGALNLRMDPYLLYRFGILVIKFALPRGQKGGKR